MQFLSKKSHFENKDKLDSIQQNVKFLSKCQTCPVIFCKISMRRKYQFEPAEKDHIFFRFVIFFQVIFRKKCLLVKRMKQNAKNAETSNFIRFIGNFMHAHKKSDYSIRSWRFAYPDLMYFFRWMTKSEHGVSNIAGEVKARIRRTANSPTNGLPLKQLLTFRNGIDITTN